MYCIMQSFSSACVCLFCFKLAICQKGYGSRKGFTLHSCNNKTQYAY